MWGPPSAKAEEVRLKVMDEAPCALAPVGSVVNRVTSMVTVRRRHMTLRPMGNPAATRAASGLPPGAGDSSSGPN
jgi:hypothetical protein